MITSLEFEIAIKLISDYKTQLEHDLNIIAKYSVRKINIQNELQKSTFKVLQKYYFHEYNIDLKNETLSNMDVSLLESINYEKLKGYRGLGRVRLYNFQKLLVSHSVLDESVL